MRVKKRLAAFAAFVLACLPIGQLRAQTPSPLMPAEIQYPSKPDGYRSLSPPRADFGPGFVFTGALTKNKFRVRDVVCQNLYPQLKAKDEPVVLTNRTFSNTSGVGLDLSLLDRMLSFLGLGSASFEANYTGKVGYTVFLGSASEVYIPLGDMWNGEAPVEVDRKCHSAIEELKRKGQFVDSVFVVSRALTINGLSFKFDKGTDISGKFVDDLEKIAKGEARISVSKSESGTNTRIDLPIHLGVVVQQIEHWVPSGAVATQEKPEVIITAHPVPGAYAILEPQ